MKVLGALLVLPVAVLLRGVMLKALWGWFVPPVFTTLPALGLMQAVGLAAAFAVFSGGGEIGLKLQEIAKAVGAQERKPWELALLAVVQPLTALAFGWALHLLM